MDLQQAVVLGVLQGLTEFLPISSSAHLILLPHLVNWPDQGLAFDVAVHVGSLGAVMGAFHRELGAMARDWGKSVVTGDFEGEARLAWAILFGTIPVGLAGITLKGVVETHMREPAVLAGALIFFGVVLGAADHLGKHKRSEDSLSAWDVLVIGCAQALALIPGTSRAGITMTAALGIGWTREAAARFSFLLAIPVIVLAGGLDILELVRSAVEPDWALLAAGTGVSALSAYLCIWGFLTWIQRIGMTPFVVYRILLGLFLLYWA